MVDLCISYLFTFKCFIIFGLDKLDFNTHILCKTIYLSILTKTSYMESHMRKLQNLSVLCFEILSNNHVTTIHKGVTLQT